MRNINRGRTHNQLYQSEVSSLMLHGGSLARNWTKLNVSSSSSGIRTHSSGTRNSPKTQNLEEKSKLTFFLFRLPAKLDSVKLIFKTVKSDLTRLKKLPISDRFWCLETCLGAIGTAVFCLFDYKCRNTRHDPFNLQYRQLLITSCVIKVWYYICP